MSTRLTFKKAIIATAIMGMFACEEEHEVFNSAKPSVEVSDEKQDISVLGFSSTEEMLANGWTKLENLNASTLNAKVAKTQSSGIHEKLTFDQLNGLGFNEHRLKDLVSAKFGHSPDGLSLNSERKFSAPDPTITDRYGYFAYIESGNPTITVTNQSDEQKVVYDYTLYNYSDETDTHTLSRSHQSGTTSNWSVTNSVNVSVGGKVGIPLISEGTIDVSVGVSASGGGSESHVVTNQISSTVTVPPHSKRRVVLIERVQDAKYEYEIPVSTTGHLGVNFGSKVDGHFYWFTPINSLIGADGTDKELGKISYNKVYGGEMFAYEAEAL